jgi:hypothetical protein
MSNPRLERYRDAYMQMAKHARYRPGAPGDGLGNVHLSHEDAADPVRLWEEATKYAISFAKDEDTDSFWIGCSDFDTNQAFIWTIEAARVLAGGNLQVAQRLLELAVRDVKRALGNRNDDGDLHDQHPAGSRDFHL